MTHEWRFPASVEENYDGDTFKLCVDLGFALRHHISARLDGIDTPELRGGSKLTKAAAKLARDEAWRFCAEADELIFKSTIWAGKYGRPVGDLIADGVSLRDWLIENGLGIPYKGGTSRAGFQERHQENAERLQAAGRLTDYGFAATNAQ